MGDDVGDMEKEILVEESLRDWSVGLGGDRDAAERVIVGHHYPADRSIPSDSGAAIRLPPSGGSAKRAEANADCAERKETQGHRAKRHEADSDAAETNGRNG